MPTEKLMSLKRNFDEQGYVVVATDEKDSTLDQAIKDIDQINSSANRKLNPSIYHYNSHPRLIEGWKQSAAIKAIALNPKVTELLSFLYQATPLPFSTINFTYGTEQPLHSDYFHFGSIPELMLAGVWVALEDIDPRAGPLSVVPGTHTMPIILPEDLGIKDVPKTTKQIKENYSLYEQWVRDFLLENEYRPITPAMKKGDCLIWAANVLHGAGKIEDPSLTRYSQVTHYHFRECDFFYNPNFSSRKKLIERDVYASEIC